MSRPIAIRTLTRLTPLLDRLDGARYYDALALWLVLSWWANAEAA